MAYDPAQHPTFCECEHETHFAEPPFTQAMSAHNYATVPPTHVVHTHDTGSWHVCEACLEHLKPFTKSSEAL